MLGRKGASAGASTLIKESTTPEVKPTIKADKPTFARIVETAINLSAMIKGTKKQMEPGATLTGVRNLIKPETAEYLYLANGWVHRAINTEAGAMIRNGYSITANKKNQQKDVDEFLERMPFHTILDEYIKNGRIYGNSYMEPFDTKDGVMIAEIPPGEMDYQRDAANNILYDDNGIPVGYIQTKEGQEVAKWDYNEIAHLKFVTIGASDVGISALQAVLYPATQAGSIRSTSAEAFNRAMNVIHVQIEGGTSEDVLEVSAALGNNFQSDSAYVTNERYTLSSINNASQSINVAEYIEPNIAEIAAAFNMPIELISATSTFDLRDFKQRYQEWLQDIRNKQLILADVLEKGIFNKFIEGGVKIAFNNPEPAGKEEMFNTISFATQSGIFDQESAKNAIIESGIMSADVFNKD